MFIVDVCYIHIIILIGTLPCWKTGAQEVAEDFCLHVYLVRAQVGTSLRCKLYIIIFFFGFSIVLFLHS